MLGGAPGSGRVIFSIRWRDHDGLAGQRGEMVKQVAGAAGRLRRPAPPSSRTQARRPRPGQSPSPAGADGYQRSVTTSHGMANGVAELCIRMHRRNALTSARPGVSRASRTGGTPGGSGAGCHVGGEDVIGVAVEVLARPTWWTSRRSTPASNGGDEGVPKHVRVWPGNPDLGCPGESPQSSGGGVAVHPGAAAVEQDRPVGAGADRGRWSGRPRVAAGRGRPWCPCRTRAAPGGRAPHPDRRCPHR